MAGVVEETDMLLGDPMFVMEVDEEWEHIKSDIKKRAKKAKEKFKPGTADRFVEALKIHIAYEKFREKNQWADAFYGMHLYLECVLDGDALLHRNKRFPKQAAEVLETLQALQGEMNACMNGIRKQIIEKKRLERHEADAASGGGGGGRRPKSPPAAAQAAPKRLSGGKLSAAATRMALDALRLDGKKTDLKLYGMDLGQEAGAPGQPKGSAPPSYDEVVAGSAYLHSRAGNRRSGGSGMRIKKVPGDGHCAFRALAQGRNGARLDSGRETQMALELRSIACGELRAKRKEEMTGTGLTVEQVILMESAKFASFDEYLGAMSRSEHAGETEFWLLAKKLACAISIYTPAGSGSFDHLMTYGDGPGIEPVRLLWQRGTFSEAGNHYDLLVPAA